MTQRPSSHSSLPPPTPPKSSRRLRSASGATGPNSKRLRQSTGSPSTVSAAKAASASASRAGAGKESKTVSESTSMLHSKDVRSVEDAGCGSSDSWDPKNDGLRSTEAAESSPTRGDGPCRRLASGDMPGLGRPRHGGVRGPLGSATAIGRPGEPSLAWQGAGGKAPPKKFTIRPFKRAPKVSDNFFSEVWSQYLEPAVRAVHTDQPIPHSLELLYGKVEDVCMHKHAAELYELLRRACDDQAQRQLGSLCLRVVEPNAFLGDVDETWKRHCAHMLRIRAIFLKLDRTFMVQGPGKSIRSLWDMGLQQFRNHFTRSPDALSKTVSGLLAWIKNDRDGESTNTARLRSLLRMFAAIGIYEESFQSPFLVATAAYYRAEAELRISESDVPQYIRHVERRLSEEADRADNVLAEITAKPLIALVEQRLIADHVTGILSKGFTLMCDEQRKADLDRLYILFARANNHTKPGELSAHEQLRSHVIAYVKKVGLEIVQDVSKDNEMVSSLLTLKTRLDDLVASSFGASTVFTHATNYAFESFVNTRENKPAELIAKYLDGVLRTGNKGYSEEELENTLDRVLTLFRFIDGKDVFEAFYKKDLSKRLLYDKSSSHDLEKVMISKLKAECGSQFTSKLEAMFRDVDSSKDMMASFRHHARSGGDYGGMSKSGLQDIELNVFVLEAARWPLSSQKKEVQLPRELVSYQQSYKAFYVENHGNRSLTWQHSDGSCVVKAHFPKGTKILSLSLYQTVIVMLFNDADTCTYSDLAARSGIEEKELCRTLLSLACGKVRVLQKNPKGPKVLKGDEFVFNKAFVHKQTRIKVNAIQMKETVEENIGTTEKVFQERSYQIDATLVRIMKTRRTLQHSALIAEVYSQLKFPHKPLDIKKRIESLIEREYLERSADDPQVYNYLA